MEQVEAGKSSQQTRLNHYFRAERKVWAILLLMPLLTYCVVAVLTFSIKPVPINTGDALYDKYLAWILEDFESNISFDTSVSALQASFENGEAFDPFAEWEAEFRDDPRYWMLRYRYSMSSTLTRWGGRKADQGHLDRARELGVVDGAVLLTLFEKTDSEIWNRVVNEMPDGQSKNDSFAERTRNQREQVDKLIGVEHSNLLTELLAVADDHSSPHYLAALVEFQRGNFQSAITHLEDGNEARHNTNLLGFPFDVHLSNLNSGKPIPDKIICGSIFVDGMSVNSPSFNQIGGMAKLLVADAVKRNDRAALDEIHTFGCRVGSAKGIELNTSMLGMLVVGFVETEFRKSLGVSISYEQIRNMDEIKNLNAQVKTLRASGGNWTQMLAPFGASPLQQAIGTTEIWLSNGRSGIQAHIEAVSHSFSEEQATLSGPIKTLFQQMESFNYNTLEFE